MGVPRYYGGRTYTRRHKAPRVRTLRYWCRSVIGWSPAMFLAILIIAHSSTTARSRPPQPVHPCAVRDAAQLSHSALASYRLATMYLPTYLPSCRPQSEIFPHALFLPLRSVSVVVVVVVLPVLWRHKGACDRFSRPSRCLSLSFFSLRDWDSFNMAIPSRE